MPDIDSTSFKEQVSQELLAGHTFRFRIVTAPVAFIAFGGFFIALSVFLAIYLNDPRNIPSILGMVGLAALFIIPGILMLGGFVEVSPTQIVWKMLAKPRTVVFGELQAYALVETVSTKGGTSYSCRVYLLSGKSKTIRCSGLKRDRPLPKKMKFHEFVMLLMSAYLQRAGVPRYTGPL